MYFVLVTSLILTLTSLVSGIFLESDVTFYLFTAENPENYIELSKENATIDGNSSTVFLIHGWSVSRHEPWYETLTQVFLSKLKKNVIQVDWSGPASQTYSETVEDVNKTARVIADFIITLVRKGTIPIENIHLCGHSLGAHVAGFAGKYTQQSGLKLPRITALDAAGPFFDDVSVSNRLAKTDADVVVALHTDPWMFGFWGSLGTVDVYANGRPFIQPGCPRRKWNDADSGCSHGRSYQFFVDALEQPGTLVATRCSSYFSFWVGFCTGNSRVDLGNDFYGSEQGDYYLTTRSKKPYGMG